ncbi:MAG TPA: hypothetical protein VF520_13645 [Thermoleophilaceae bacterium]|jgi:hypothetical protein
MSPLFCRHNRFTADCPICSKGTVLDPERGTGRRPAKPASRRSGGRAGAGGRTAGGATGTRQFSGPHVKAGPYERPDGGRYEVRLERVPGGLRLAQWSGGSLERRAPELPAADLAGLVAAALEGDLLEERDRRALAAAVPAAEPVAASAGAVDGEPAGAAPGAGEPYGASPGRAGDMREELRVDGVGDGRLRVGRWVFWPGRGWELQDAPPMFPAARYAEALGGAARRGLLG